MMFMSFATAVLNQKVVIELAVVQHVSLKQYAMELPLKIALLDGDYSDWNTHILYSSLTSESTYYRLLFTSITLSSLFFFFPSHLSMYFLEMWLGNE